MTSPTTHTTADGRGAGAPLAGEGSGLPADEQLPLSAPGLITALERLQIAGAVGASLLVSRGHAWFMISRAAAPATVEIEAAPSRVLPRALALSPERANRLRAAGFVAGGPGQRPLRRAQALEAAGRAPLADELLALLDAVYGEASLGEGGLRLRLGAPDPLRGDALIQRMTEAARAADPAVGRSRLYAAMLDAELLLLVEPDGAPTQVGELSGWPVYAAFTDHDALRRQDARAPLHRRLGGRALFPLLLEHRVGSLLINSAGPVGGELYRNEVQTLAGAVYRAPPRPRS
ncbi:MAG: SseB family protein [Deltaproteobacteria bacterium]|nr:SseB family protein [Deltaproteobacteria bacterium]